MLIGMLSPWLVISGGKTLSGLDLEIFGSLSFITIFLAVLGTAVSLFGKKIKKVLLPLGIICLGWGIYLFLQIKAIGINYLAAGGLDKSLAANFFGTGYGVHIIIIGGLLVLASGILNLKDEDGSKE